MNSTNDWQNQLHKLAQLYARTLSAEELEIWGNVLTPVTRKALIYACDNWARNGRFFPKPIDLLDLVDVYNRGLQPSKFTHYEHHGRGYGDGDMLALWKLVSAKSIQLNRKLSIPEIWQELNVIDQRRPDGPPMWRVR